MSAVVRAFGRQALRASRVALGLAVLGILAACAASQSGADAPAGTLSVHGLLVAPEGVGLPLGAQAVVEVREATPPRRVLAEARVPWPAFDTTVPFEVRVPAERLMPGATLQVRAALTGLGGVQSLSEPRPIAARRGRVDLGRLVLAPARMDAFSTALQCGELRIVIGYTQDAMRLRIAGDAGRIMQPVGGPAGGVHVLESAAEPGTRLVLDLDRNTANLTWKDRPWPECVKVPLSDEDAKLSQ